MLHARCRGIGIAAAELTGGNYAIGENNLGIHSDVDGLDAESLAALRAYGWPGNVRELRNAIERAVVTREQGRIALHDLPEEIYEVRHSEDEFVVRVGSTLEAVEHELIRRTLEATGNNRSRAADILGVSRRSFYVMLHKNGFQPRERRSSRSSDRNPRT